MSKKKVDVYFDVVSPYSYIGVAVIARYREKWNLDLNLKPVFLGGIMQAAENTPPAMVPAKGRYMLLHDLPRAASLAGLHVQQPEHFPALTITAMRVLHAARASKPEGSEEQYQLVLDLALRMWRGYWGGGGCNLGTKEGIKKALLASSGIKEAVVDSLLERASDPAVKQSLKAMTEEAVSMGAFGNPWFVVHEPQSGVGRSPAVFFGSDRFDVLARELGETYSGPLPGQNPAARL